MKATVERNQDGRAIRLDLEVTDEVRELRIPALVAQGGRHGFDMSLHNALVNLGIATQDDVFDVIHTDGTLAYLLDEEDGQDADYYAEWGISGLQEEGVENVGWITWTTEESRTAEVMDSPKEVWAGSTDVHEGYASFTLMTKALTHEDRELVAELLNDLMDEVRDRTCAEKSDSYVRFNDRRLKE